MNEDFKPYFKCTDYVFGANLMAACVQLVGLAATVAGIFAVLWCLLGPPN